MTTAATIFFTDPPIQSIRRYHGDINQGSHATEACQTRSWPRTHRFDAAARALPSAPMPHIALRRSVRRRTQVDAVAETKAGHDKSRGNQLGASLDRHPSISSGPALVPAIHAGTAPATEKASTARCTRRCGGARACALAIAAVLRLQSANRNHFGINPVTISLDRFQ